MNSKDTATIVLHKSFKAIAETNHCQGHPLTKVIMVKHQKVAALLEMNFSYSRPFIKQVYILNRLLYSCHAFSTF